MLRAVLTLLLLATPEMIPPDEGELLGRTAPDVSFQLADGKTSKLSDFKGKPVVLSFWASWCGPCRKELPALAELASKRPEVTFLAVNVDKDRPPAERFIRELKMPLPVAYDPESSVMAKFDVVVMPTMFMVDKNGTVKFRKTGFSSEGNRSASDSGATSRRSGRRGPSLSARSGSWAR